MAYIGFQGSQKNTKLCELVETTIAEVGHKGAGGLGNPSWQRCSFKPMPPSKAMSRDGFAMFPLDHPA